MLALGIVTDEWSGPASEQQSIKRFDPRRRRGSWPLDIPELICFEAAGELGGAVPRQ